MQVDTQHHAGSSRARARVALVATGVALLLTAACAKGEHGQGDTTAASAAGTANAADSAAAAHASQPSPQLSDANILAMEAGSDSSEVEVARLAAAKAADAGVKAYANQLVADHGKALQEVKALAKKTAITPQEPPGDTTAQQTSHLKERFSALAKGAAFDSAFVNHEVEDHQHDIEEAHRMESAAQNADVKAEVQKSLPVLQKHLDRAQQLAGKWKKS